MVFFSPSGVSLTETILKSEVKPHRPKVRLVAMGRSTEARLKEMDLTVSGVSKSPKPDSLLAVIKTLVTQTAA
ncbi:Uroporphyrinogen-III synthase [Fasciolopsis buskii]|uniref:Uroporphyrinogen-III synthase n=1 Tax=Fasciolopsis buskii TaxID=27845 RepID=A0A8E0RN26_9TREM|nr:Uroporphyrinogen-III synthase [Fasciolopsis buski]